MFHELVAVAFPAILYFLSATHDSLTIQTENATALSFLAKFFDMPHLQLSSNAFWRQDVHSAHTCGTYYEHAFILQDEEIKQAAAAVCADKIWSIPKTSRLLHVPDASFWLELVARGPLSMQNAAEEMSKGGSDRGEKAQFYNFVGTEFSRRMSTLIVDFCRFNRPLDKNVFRALTHETALPCVDGEAAIWMLELERLFDEPDDSKLTPLQERCIEAFARDWNRMGISLLQYNKTAKQLRKQSSLVLHELMSRTLSGVSKRSAQVLAGIPISRQI